MIEGKPPTKEPKHPDLVYFLYEPDQSGKSAITKQHMSDFKYLRALKYSLVSFVNAHIRRYLLATHRPLAFDCTASCSNSFHDYELICMPDIYIYSSIPLNIDKDGMSPKIYVRDLKSIFNMCPIDILSMETPYIPGLKGALMLYHSQNSDTTREFILSDVDIMFYNVKTPVDPKAIYMSGLEYQPLFSFLAFQKGLQVFSSFGKKKKQDIEQYRFYEKHLKIPLECQIFNNGIMKVPHCHCQRFFEMYYQYLDDLSKTDIENLKWPWPFWTAEMFATNYAITQLAIEENVPVRRFDPDVMDIIHDINGQYDLYLKGVLNL